jgi:hypothetical protein
MNKSSKEYSYDKHDEEKMILSQNISKEDSKLGLLRRVESNSIFSKFNRSDKKESNNNSLIKSKEKEKIIKSISKSFKEDESGSEEGVQVKNKNEKQKQHESDDKNSLNSYNENDNKENFRKLHKKEKIVKYFN